MTRMWTVPQSFAWVRQAEGAREAWALDAEKNQIFAISPVALAIWQAAEGKSGAAAVTESLVESEGWQRDEIADAVEDFLRLLLERGFLREVEV